MKTPAIKVSIDKDEALKLCYAFSDLGFTFQDWEDNPNIEGNRIQWHILHLKPGDFLYKFNRIEFYVK